MRVFIVITDSAGTQLAYQPAFTDLHYVIAITTIGALEVTFPASFDDSLLVKDGRIGVYRQIAGRPPSLDGQGVYLIRSWQYTEHTTTVTAVHANHLLTRRIIAYDDGTAYTVKAAAAAGNQVKAFARENIGALINTTDRDGTQTGADLSTYLTIDADLGDGASVAKSAARDNLWDVIVDLCQASTTAGTYLAAQVVSNGMTDLTLRTFAGQYGVDHRSSTSNPVILSRDRGNLENEALTIRADDEVTAAIAGGEGEDSARLIATSLDTSRLGESVFARAERFTNDSNTNSAPPLQDTADAAVRAGRPRIEAQGDLVDTPGTTRGLHYDIGDIVTAEIRGMAVDVRIEAIEVTANNRGIRQSVTLRSLT